MANGGHFNWYIHQAYERLQQFILEQISIIVKPVSAGQVQKLASEYGLKWTGESINLVELAYGLWLSRQLNNGNANISEIIHWLEDSLDVKIKRVYRRWTEIARRERPHTTKFLDRMRDSINLYLQVSDDLKEQKNTQTKNTGKH